MNRDEGASEHESYGSLLSGLLKDLQDLLRGEVRLAKAELRDDLSAAMRGVSMLAVAALLSLVGLIMLMIGLAAFLMEWMENWQAYGLVGLVLVVLAAIAGLLGKDQLSAANLAPDRTIESLKEDKQWASQQIRSLRN